MQTTLLKKLAKAACAFALAVAGISGCATQTIVSDQDAPVAAKLSAHPALPIQNWFVEARSAVERQLNTDLDHVVLQITDAKGIAVHAKSSLLAALEHDLENSRYAEQLVENILGVQTESVLAIYAPDVKQILLHEKNIDKFLENNTDNQKHSIQALLIHELIHAADDRNYDAFEQRAMSYQEVFAKSAVVEGHAQWQTRKICKSIGCGDAFEGLNRYMFHSDALDDPALQYMQSRSFKNLEFVYKEGERFIDKLKRRNNADSAIRLAFKKPPRDSIQIIDTDSFPDRNRERRNDRLSLIIEKSTKPWSKNNTSRLKRNVLAAAAFSVNPSARQPVVNFYTSKILAATKHEYYQHPSETPIPIAVIAMLTDSDITAQKTASLIFSTTLDTYNSLQGDLVKLTDWKTEQHNAELPERFVIDMSSASGYLQNGLVGAEYPVEVITATSGPYLVHIDGRYIDGRENLMQFAGRLLQEMRAND